MAHRSARLTVFGSRLLVQRIEQEDMSVALANGDVRRQPADCH